MTGSLAFLLGGVVLLYLGAELLVRGAARLGVRAGIAPVVVGLTIVSMGTSAPEFVVSVLAVLRDRPDMAVGNVLGSNLANVGLILGLAAIIRPLDVAESVVRRDVPWMLVVTVLAFPALWGLHLGRVEGGALVLLLALYVWVLARSRKDSWVMSRSDLAAVDQSSSEGVRAEAPARPGLAVQLLKVGGGVGLLAVGGQGIVEGASELVSLLGVSDLVVGLSVVAVGTSLPELATTILAALKKQADLAVGNIVGSNIFNLTFVLGGTALVHPLPLAERVLTVEYPVVLAMSLLLLPVVMVGRHVGRLRGLLLLGAYVGAWVWIQGAGGVPAVG